MGHNECNTIKEVYRTKCLNKILDRSYINNSTATEYVEKAKSTRVEEIIKIRDENNETKNKTTKTRGNEELDL